ncbi:aldehyde:ferredoxin oxidoreductase [Alkalispirochaeta odontotermitis]|nr:aldehyde:ferredoxin oxidoreductase [Alkalispirochaeta odontotermitis]CAB1074831.1 Tungsten-containing aldehyde:ferredoxin oxidoreductase (EC [Olavius algarvensis Delta 1 endosymbiont]
MDGFYGRILKVDLNRKSFEIDNIEDAVYEKYLGGKGLASYLLAELNPPGVDPLAPENTLIFTNGPFGGSTLWGSCRYGVFTKSPLTGFFTESYSGGKTPDAIDATGFDAVVIQGRCDEPAVLTVHPDGVDFHAAGDLWGQETYGVEDAIKERFAREEYRKKGALVIGPASENLVRFGCIKNDVWRSAGRTGAGTVMGSKQVKGILFTGNRKRTHADVAGVKEFSKNFMAEFKDHAAANAYRTLGTPMLVKMTNTAGAFPNRYWTKGTMDNWENISAEALVEKMAPTPHGCGKCFMQCGKLGTVKEGRHAGLKIEGPEYETIFAFGGLCLIDSIEEIVYLNDICDRLGMDTITAGNLCAFTIEAARRGKVDFKIDYGQVDAIADLLQLMARREGLGEVLSQGIKHAAEKWDLEDIAVHVKGMEPPGYDPRSLKGMGLAYAASDRGACHLRATFYKPELAGMIPPEQIEGKAEMFLDFEDRLAIFDTLILCRFYRDFYLWDVLEDIIHKATGLDAGEAALKEKARAIATLIRRFNLREGMQPADERLPKALHRALTDTGQVITEDQLEVMLKEYYQLQGWGEDGQIGD